MYLTIENKPKLEVFVAIFQILKNWSSHINMYFKTDKLYIQSMDKSHICLSDITVSNKWFTNYQCTTDDKITVDSSNFAMLINYALKHDKLELKYEQATDPDKLYINYLNEKSNKGVFDHFFELSLIDADDDSLEIPSLEYDVEFIINSKKIVELFTELLAFGQNLNIKCSETMIELKANGDTTKLQVNIPVDDLEEYATTEGEQSDISFSLSHLCKMCLSTKISQTVKISISDDCPMELNYDLGDDSKVLFFIAPKIQEN